MFNIKSAFFFLSQSGSLFDQLRNFYVYDTKHLRSKFTSLHLLVNTFVIVTIKKIKHPVFVELPRCIKNALTAPPLKWNQFFRTPWATNVEVKTKTNNVILRCI